MDGYQFIAAIVQSLVALAWPVAFVIAVALFRGRLTQLLPFLRLKHKETEFSFRLDQAENEIKQIPRPALDNEVIEPTPEEKTRYEQIAEISPRAAILEKRSDLEQTINTIAQPYLIRHAQGSGKSHTLLEAIRVLRKEKIIDETTSALLDDLRAIGNQAAHQPNEPAVNNKVAALRFGKLVDTLIQYMNSLT
jgi:Domain of unknown function (DUF4145)